MEKVEINEDYFMTGKLPVPDNGVIIRLCRARYPDETPDALGKPSGKARGCSNQTIPSNVEINTPDGDYSMNYYINKAKRIVGTDGKPQFTGGILGDVIVQDGQLHVGPNEGRLLFFLTHHPCNRESIYRPKNKEPMFYIYDAKAARRKIVEADTAYIDAVVLINSLGGEELKNIAKVVPGAYGDGFTEEDIKIELKIYAKNNPGLFMELATRKDENKVKANVIDAKKSGSVNWNEDLKRWQFPGQPKQDMNVPHGADPLQFIVDFYMKPENEASLTFLKEMTAHNLATKPNKTKGR